ncbi:MAG: hypothetical protein N2448_03265 [Caloramator sp.]|nr:hypothetical protein [Caloramator sp.]
MKKMFKTRVLAFCLKEIPSAKIGVINVLKYLDSTNRIQFKFKETLNITKIDVAEADVVICIRGSEKLEYDIIKQCKKLNKYLIYFLDDDLLNVPTIVKSSVYYRNKEIINLIINIMKECNCLWTTNHNIEKKYKKYFLKTAVINAPYEVMENIDNCKQLNRNSIVIGFAGGIDHSELLDKILDGVINEILAKYKERVKFEFFGARPKLIDKYKLNYIPYTNDYYLYKQMIINRKWDIALAPLENTEFNSCKYFNKFLEYSSIGIAGIYSNVEPYIFVVKHNENGLLSNNTKESWVNNISYLIENPSNIKNISLKAKETIKSNFNILKISEQLISSIPEVVNYKAPQCSIKEIKGIGNKNNKNYFLFKLISLIKREKFKTFSYIFFKILDKIKIY